MPGRVSVRNPDVQERGEQEHKVLMGLAGTLSHRRTWSLKTSFWTFSKVIFQMNLSQRGAVKGRHIVVKSGLNPQDSMYSRKFLHATHM